MGGHDTRKAAKGSQIAAQCVDMWFHYHLLKWDELFAFFDCTGINSSDISAIREGLTEAPPKFIEEVMRINAALMDGREAYPLKN